MLVDDTLPTLITGTSGTPTAYQYRMLTQLVDIMVGKNYVVYHGGAIGVDQFVHRLALKHGILIEVFPSLQHQHWAEAPGAYAWGRVHESMPALKRNAVMAKLAEYVIAAPETDEEVLRSGTWATVRYAAKAGKEVTIIKPNGTMRRYVHA